MGPRSIALAFLLAAGTLRGSQQTPVRDGATALPEAERARVSELISLLGHPWYQERERAQAELLRLPACWTGFLSRELERAGDLEIQARLAEIVELVGRIRWRSGIEESLTEARRFDRPLLVFCSSTALEDADQSPLREAFSDPTLVDFVNGQFIPVWQSSTAFPMGEAVLFCARDGTVRHAVIGIFPAQTILEEARRAAQTFCRIESPEAAAVEHGAFLARLERAEGLRALVKGCRRAAPLIGKPVATVLSIQMRLPPRRG